MSEARDAAIESMAQAIHEIDGNAVPWAMEEQWMRDDYIKEATAALDAIPDACWIPLTVEHGVLRATPWPDTRLARWPKVVYRESLPTTQSEKCATCGGIGRVPHPVVGKTFAMPCPDCGGGHSEPECP